MGSYLSIPLYSRNTVTLEPIAKKADTGAVQVVPSSVSSESQNDTKVMDTTSPTTSNPTDVCITSEKKEEPKESKKEVKKEEPKEPKKEEPKKEESKKIFLELTEPSKKMDLMIVNKEPLAVEPQNIKAESKNNTKIQVIEEKTEEDNVLLLSSDELKQHILGMAEDTVKQQKENAIVLHKKVCAEIVQHAKNDSDEENAVPLSREELRNHVLRELENQSKKTTITIEKIIKPYVIELCKEKVKSPPLEPVKEETVQDVHPFLLEYGVNPIKTNTLLIQNHTYQKVESSAIASEPVAPTHAQNNHKKNKKKKH
jgi:hypothetical protein